MEMVCQVNQRVRLGVTPLQVGCMTGSVDADVEDVSGTR